MSLRYNVESFIIEEDFERQRHLLSVHERIRGESGSNLEFWTSQFCNIPSNYLISQCFLSTFLLNERYTFRDMEEEKGTGKPKPSQEG